MNTPAKKDDTVKPVEKTANTPAKKDDTVKPVKTTAAVKKNDDIESTISALTIGNVYFILN